MTHYITAQLIGATAVAVALTVYQFNERKTMLRLSAVAALLYAMHFFMLGAPTGAAMNLISSGRSYTFQRVKPTKQTRWVLYLILGVLGVATALTWQGPRSLFAMAGSILSTIAFWQKNARVIRRLALLAPPLWFVYDALSGSYPGMFVEVFNVVSILIGRYRFDVAAARTRL